MLQCMVVNITNMLTKGSSKLTPKRRKELILDLCRAFSTLKSPEEVADVLLDLLTPKEIETIAKRLQIAEQLIHKIDYSSIRQDLRVGFSTIARVNTWLNLAGRGFKTIFARKKKVKEPISDEEKYDPFSWYNVKRRYSLYFWPQLLVEEFMKIADEKQKYKIKEVFEKLEEKKKEFTGKTNKELFEMFSNQFRDTKKNVKNTNNGFK